MRGVNQAIILATGHAATDESRLGGAGPHRPADRHLHGDAQSGQHRRRAVARRAAPPDAGCRDRRGDDAAAAHRRRHARQLADEAARARLRLAGLIVVGDIVAVRAAAAAGGRRREPRDDRARPHRRRAALGLGQDHASPSACCARWRGAALRCAARNPGPTTSIPASMPRRPARGRQSRQLGHAADLLDGLLGEAAEDAELWSSKAPWACSTAFPAAPAVPARPPISPRALGLPVLLVLDVSGQSQTAAAVAKGFATYDPAVRMAGVVLNRLGSERHRELVADAIEALGLPVVGAILRDRRSSCRSGISASSRRASMLIYGASRPPCRHGRAPARPRRHHGDGAPSSPATAALLGDACRRRASASRSPDAAFTFLYPQCSMAGARPAPRSCRSRRLPTRRRRRIATSAGCPAAIPSSMPAPRGGAPFLAGMQRFAGRVRSTASAAASWCWAKALEDAAGDTPRMLGLLGHATSFAKRKMHLGYREARLLADTSARRGRRISAAMNSITRPRFRAARTTNRSSMSPMRRGGP